MKITSLILLSVLLACATSKIYWSVECCPLRVFVGNYPPQSRAAKLITQDITDVSPKLYSLTQEQARSIIPNLDKKLASGKKFFEPTAAQEGIITKNLNNPRQKIYQTLTPIDKQFQQINAKLQAAKQLNFDVIKVLQPLPTIKNAQAVAPSPIFKAQGLAGIARLGK